MAETIAGLKIQIKLDGADAVGARFADIGRVTGELKAKLSEIGVAIKAARAAGDPLKVEALKAAGREIESAIGKLSRLREAARIDQARGILDVRPWRDIQREIDQARAAYARLAASGKLSMGEQAQAFAHLQNKIADLKSQTNVWVQSLDKVRGALAGLAAGGAAFGVGVRNAVNFETAMVGVQRAASLTRAETEALGQEFQRMSTRIAMGANDIARIAAMGSKFGVAKADIARFAELTAIAARQFEMLPDEAGRSLGILSRLLGVSIRDMDAFIGMINASADAVGVAERDIIETLTLAGASAQQFGLATHQATALATSFLSVGATAQQAGTAMRTLLSRLQAAAQDSGEAGRALKALVGDTQAFSQSISRDAQGALNQLLGKLAELGREDRFAVMKAIFQEGLDTENISKLVAKLDQYKAAQDTAGKSADDFRAQLDKLNATDLGTLGAEFQNLRDAAENLGTSLGQTITPLVRILTIGLQEAAIAVKSFVDAFPNLSAALGIFATIAIGAGALRIAMGGVVMLFGKIAASAMALLNPLRSVGVAVAALGGAAPLISRLAIAFRALLGPIGLVTTAIMLGVDAWNLWKKKAQEASNVKPGEGRFAGRGASGSWGDAQGGKPDTDGALRAGLEWDQLAESLKKSNQKMAEEIDRIKALGAKLKKPADEIGRMIAAVREKYADKGASHAERLPDLKKPFEADLKAMQSALKTQADILETALAGRLVDVQAYWQAKEAMDARAFAAERERLGRELAAQQDLIARLSATRPRDAGQREQVAQKLQDARNWAAELRAELDALDGREVAAKFRLEIDRERALQDIRDAVAEAQAEIARLTGTETPELRRAAIERSLRPMLERLAQDAEGAQLADRLIDLRAKEAELAAFERQWQAALERMRAAEQSANAQAQAGLITVSQAQEMIAQAHREAASAMEDLLPKMEAIANAIGKEAVARIEQWKTALLEAKNVIDPVAAAINTDVKNAFVSMFEAIGSGAKSAKDAFLDFARAVIASLQRIAAQKLAEQIFGSFGKGGGLGAIIAWLFKGFAAGGPVPGSGNRDSVPALLTPGEYVIRRDVAQRLGRDLLDAINGGGWLPRVSVGRLAFASGGAVPAVSPAPVAAPAQAVRIVNVIDPGLAADYLNSAAGERTILNVLSRNGSAVRELLR
jgi:TP901 family phage tail tape measure protein